MTDAEIRRHERSAAQGAPRKERVSPTSRAGSSFAFSPLEVPRRYPLRFGRETAAPLAPPSLTPLTPLIDSAVAGPRLDQAAAREICRWVPNLLSLKTAPRWAREGEAEATRALEKNLTALWGMDACVTGLACVRRFEAALETVRSFHEHFGSERGRVLALGSPSASLQRAVDRSGYRLLTLESWSVAAIGEVLATERFELAAVVAAVPEREGDFSTVGRIADAIELVHGVGVQVILDGAPLNALHGIALPRDLGADLVACDLGRLLEFTPEGTGTGALAVRSHLEPFLPLRPAATSDDRAPRADRWARLDDTESILTALALLYSEGAHGLRRQAEERALAARCRRHEAPLPTALEAAFFSCEAEAAPDSGDGTR